MVSGLHAEQDCSSGGPYHLTLPGSRPGSWNDRAGHLVCGVCGFLHLHLCAM